MDTELWTIELNLDSDFEDSCSWHIDCIKDTTLRNMECALKKIPVNRWVLVGISTSLQEANNMAKHMRIVMCQIDGREPKNLPFA